MVSRKRTDSHDQRGRPDLGDGLPAHRHHHERREELGHRRADIACAEYAERRALPLLGIEFGDVGHADREGAAGNADAKRRDQQLGIAVGIGGEEGGDRREHHDPGEDAAAAELVGPDAQGPRG